MEKKYSAKALKEACERYFNSISTVVKHKDFETGEYFLNILGEVIEEKVFVTPPSITALTVELGISRKTWSIYSRTDEDGKETPHSKVCAWAKSVCEAYLNTQLLKRDKVDGIKFDLNFNYGWATESKQSIKMEADVKQENTNLPSIDNMSMQEKIAFYESTNAKFQKLIAFGELKAEDNDGGDAVDG